MPNSKTIKKKKKIKVTYHLVPLPPEELQRRLDRAYDVLFTAVLNKKEKL